MAYADPLDERLRAARRKHYHENKQQYLDRNAASLAECLRIMQDAKSVPCMDCGQSYPHYVMDFDHRNPTQKIAEVGRMARHGKRKLLEEIAKCDVVCANCHRERTHGAIV